MALINATFVTSAASKDGWPNDDLKEVCLVGKSNVGKSSLINALTGQKKLAKTSKTPGCTKLLNFFDINGEYRLVDSPGYGYAATKHQTYFDFENLMSEYIYDRKNLKLVILLIDSRHEPTPLDIEMFELLNSSSVEFAVIATKKDQLNQKAFAQSKKDIAKAFKGIDEAGIHYISVNDKNSVSEVEQLINEKAKGE